MNPYISSTFSKDNTPFSEVLEVLNQNSIFSVEIGSNHAFEHSYDYIKEYKNFDFLVHNYFPIPNKELVVNIASQNEDLRQRSINHIFRAIDFCDEIGSSLYTFHPGFLTDPDGSNLLSDNYDFQWKNELLKHTSYEKSLNTMFLSLDEIVKYASERQVSICIESEGSFNKKDHLLMQKPEEYINLFKKYNATDLGISLNIGHLYLASKAFEFSISDFIDLIEDYIVSFELSHNNGIEDQHLPLHEVAWYWDFIFDKRFEDAFKILEFRDQSIDTIKQSIELFKKKETGE